MGRFTKPDLDGGGKDLHGEIYQTRFLDGGGEDLHGEMLHNPLIYMGGFVISPCKSKHMDIYVCIYIHIYMYLCVYQFFSYPITQANDPKQMVKDNLALKIESLVDLCKQTGVLEPIQKR